MKRLVPLALAVSAVVSTLAFMSSSASAIPVFARKYNTQCNMCHTVPPRLNKFGVAFKQNGFELPQGTVLPESETWGNQVLSNDEPKAIVGAGFPVMLRTGLHTEVSGSNTMLGVSAANAPLGLILGEFGMIGGGSLETQFGGLGYWVDAPGAVIGAFEVDFNVNPMFKVTVANAIAPQVGYGLGLPIMAFGANTIGLNNVGAVPPPLPITVDRNEAATTTNGIFVWGNNSLPGVEVRGTTNPSTGLGLNYSAGYLTRPVGTANGVVAGAGTNIGGQDGSAYYLSGSYFVNSINTNITVGYSSEKATVAGVPAPGPAPALPPDATQMLVSAAWNVGENLQATLTYNSFGGVNAPMFSGVGPGAAAVPLALVGVAEGYTSVITFAPEWLITSQLYVGGRYSVARGAGVGTNGAVTATPDANVIAIGAGYKLLQNVQVYLNYTTKTDNNTGAANTANARNAGNSLVAGIDFVL